MSVAELYSESVSIAPARRTSARGKFLFTGDEKTYVRGVTYGAFRPDAEGNEYRDRDAIERDFAQMASHGVNAVRIPHTMPPTSLLDIALRYGLRVMVGLSAEQYVGYLIDGNKNGNPDIEAVVRAKVRACAGHPALLCYAIGNEIQAPVVRWLGRRRIETYLERMYEVVKQEDSEGLVTYVNYPTTEYLQLPFLDLVCFNVYLENRPNLRAYLARLQNIAGDRPLIMSEVGLDSRRNGETAQASVLDWQVRASFEAGCAGVFIFSWTDEWFRAGAEVDDWEFGLTDRERKPKPALASVRRAFDSVPCAAERATPRISVVVCSYNGGRTIRECCEGLRKLEYPNFEVIVIDDGSTDATAAIAREYGFFVISTENRGLSNARNTGLAAASGEIVAYIDDDAYPDPHWLTYLAETFSTTSHVGVGGPNITPLDDGPIAQCVANSPGNPTHVLLTDEEAEHLPGCNMAFRKEALAAIGGFDPYFRVAGDDVDVCWRLRDRGWTLGFSPSAMVWHHRRGSVRAYLKQQRGYGRAEGLLERKWPERHNTLGHRGWEGRMYGAGLTRPLPILTPVIYQGVWGNAPFQSLYEQTPTTLLSLPLMPEWYEGVFLLLGLSALGLLWKPLLLALPLFLLSVGALLVQAVTSARHARFRMKPRSRWEGWKRTGLTIGLHLLQPLARLWGRLTAAPRREAVGVWVFPRPRSWGAWTERWRAPEERLQSLESFLRADGELVARGGEFDSWDLEVRDGMLGSVRALMAVEDHGGGAQLVRFRLWPRLSVVALSMVATLFVLAALASADRAWVASMILGSLALAVSIGTFIGWGRVTAAYVRAVEQTGIVQESTSR
ncbi:MAG TPA: glycosyltransferase [Vicinamibacteria bacterium]|nr:glycosyltransferase [Vicinamibacteria bacterium]